MLHCASFITAPEVHNCLVELDGEQAEEGKEAAQEYGEADGVGWQASSSCKKPFNLIMPDANDAMQH